MISDTSPRKRIKIESTLCSSPICITSSSEDEEQHYEDDDDLPSDLLEPPDNNSCYISHDSPVLVSNLKQKPERQVSRLFWKAGDYGDCEADPAGRMFPPNGVDHVRVHPKFLHSNATSHKWALGAIAELLDNALDEVSYGATFVKVDVLKKQKDSAAMLLFEDNGGGMTPECMRYCMSLGYSAKSKMVNTIGQYGNGFKTSTMRLGSDVIVFSRSPGKDGCKCTCSIGMLSYTFLRETCQQDIIVPMIDFEVQSYGLEKLLRGSRDDWNRNIELIKQWSPFPTENDLLYQLELIKFQGTRIIVYNLWENEEGRLELDLETDPHDIQLRGVSKDPKHVEMAERLPNSKHFFTYRYSLRSYAAILYLRLPNTFKMILRDKEIKHHALVDDMMIIQKETYRPCRKENDKESLPSNIKAVVTIGFVKDAEKHHDIQGFNVYHKNRLIKPFWRIWNAAGSQGRGIIGVLEANFVEPAHDKQGFERTSVLSRLEARLLKMQKDYWCRHSHRIGYYNHHAKKEQSKLSSKNIMEASFNQMEQSKHNAKQRQEQPNVLIPESELLLTNIPRSVRSYRKRLPTSKIRRYINSFRNLSEGLGLSQSHISVTDKTRSVSPPHQPNVDTLSDRNMVSNTNSNRKDVSNVESHQQHTTDRNMHSNTDRKDVANVEQKNWLQLLEKQLANLKSQLEDTEKRVQVAIKERDALKKELEEERNRTDARDIELRRKLRDTLIRIKELEAENKRLKSTHC